MFLKYAAIGGFVGILAMLILVLLEQILSESKVSYLISVIVVYAAGIILSFILQKKFTFDVSQKSDENKPFARFVFVALIGAICTAIFSYILRYLLPWPIRLGLVAGPVAFAISCVGSSIVTFYLNKKWVFKV